MAMHRAILLSYCLLLAATLGTSELVQATNICQGNPADVFFVLDSSSSIARPDFGRQLIFLQAVVEALDVSRDMTRVGALSYSNWAFIDFHMDTYRTKQQVKAAIGRIRQINGDTNTAAALAFMRDVAFSPGHGARPDVPRIAVVVTDGKSNKPWQTAREALRARLQGIHVFAIGIGEEVDREELRRIASSPKAEHVFHVPYYSDLTARMAKLLALETCKVTVKPTRPPTTTTTTTTTTTPKPPTPTPTIATCGDAELADIVFGSSPNSSPKNTVKTLEFFRDVTGHIDTGDDRIRVGLVPKECAAGVPELNIRNFTDKDEVIRKLNQMHVTSARKSPVSVLRHMRKVSFRTEHGARPESRKLAVLVIDETDQRNMMHILREAFMLQARPQTELYVIGVGKGLSQSDLEVMVPDLNHLIQVDSYDDLAEQVLRLRHLLCPVPST